MIRGTAEFISHRTPYDRGTVLPVHVHKKAVRALGISESFRKGFSKHSVLAGVVMRADLIVDGFTFSKAEVGGMDATQRILGMYEALNRSDINVFLLNGCVISWYNVIDLNRIFSQSGVPLVCVTYSDSEGLETFFKENFPEDWERRAEVYRKNGSRTPLTLHTSHTVYARSLGINEEETLRLLNKLTLHGAIPEPLRIARLLARSLQSSSLTQRQSDHAHT